MPYICNAKGPIITFNYIENVDKTFNYIENFYKEEQEDPFNSSIKIIEGFNENEVLIVPKFIENKGFFERFFNFFS